MNEPAFVLHTRPWRETSLIAELLTPGHGRVGVVARGGRRGRRGAAGVLQPFSLLQVTLRGRGELKTLVSAEPEQTLLLRGERLFAGLYLNELLLRLLQRDEAQPEIFSDYAGTLARLAHLDPQYAARDMEPALRRFELRLLVALGYGFPLDQDVQGHALDAARRYTLIPDEGLAVVGDTVRDAGYELEFEGSHLLALAADVLSEPEVLHTAKRLTRLALAGHLGGRPLHSRALFRRWQAAEDDDQRP